MTDYTELKARMLAWCDTCTTFGLDSIGQDVKAGLDAIEFLERQIAELSKEAVPVAWGIAVEDEMCDAYINKDACVREFDRRNKLYPDTPRILVDLFTSPPNTADIEQRVAEAVAKMLEADANALASECGYEDMGSLSFGTGAHAVAKMGRYNELLELAESVRSGNWREYL